MAVIFSGQRKQSRNKFRHNIELQYTVRIFGENRKVRLYIGLQYIVIIFGRENKTEGNKNGD